MSSIRAHAARPIAEALEPDELPAAKQRYQKLSDAFHARFGVHATHLTRAAGRFNVIGEHVDYSGFPVFPQAINREFTVLTAKTEDAAVKIHADSGGFGDSEFGYDDLDTLKKGDFANYVKTGLERILEYEGVQPSGLRIFISSDLPPNAGLSSSAALLVSTCLALLATLSPTADVPIQEFINTTIAAEHAVGVSCGGMDQTISVYGRTCFIEFFPRLSVTPLAFSRGHLVLAHCQVDADKKLTAEVNYNRRVFECGAATKILSKELGIQRECKILREVVEEKYKPTSHEEQVQAVSDLLSDIDKHLKPVTWTPAALQKYGVSNIPANVDSFPIYERTKHVLSEASRVLEFRRVLTKGSLTDDDLKGLGSLMRQSHESCRDLFQCSCPELDELVETSLRNGALGARLTGAGWGGFTVSLLPEGSDVEAFEKSLIEQYYAKHGVKKSVAVLKVRERSGASTHLLKDVLQ